MVVLIQSCDCLSFLGLYPKFQQFWTGNAVSAAGSLLEGSKFWSCSTIIHQPVESFASLFHPTALQHPNPETQSYEPPDFCDLTKPHSLSK